MERETAQRAGEGGPRTILADELNPPDLAFVGSLAKAMGLSLADCMALLTRPLESIPSDHTPTRIENGSITHLNLFRKLGRMSRIPRLGNLGHLRSLNCAIHSLNELDLRDNPHLQSLDCSSHFSPDFVVDISRCYQIRHVAHSAYIVYDKKYYCRLICTELQKRYLFPRARKGFEVRASDAAELHAFVKHYNWDEGVGILRWIVKQESCDRGTALMVYWKSGPGWYTQYARKEDVPSHALEGYNLIKEIERRYRRGFYERGGFYFDPRDDNGYDWTGQHAGVEAVSPIPERMYEPVRAG